MITQNKEFTGRREQFGLHPKLKHHTCEEAVGRSGFLIPEGAYKAKK
jgi:hypothetical protein